MSYHQTFKMLSYLHIYKETARTPTTDKNISLKYPYYIQKQRNFTEMKKKVVTFFFFDNKVKGRFLPLLFIQYAFKMWPFSFPA